MIDPALAWLDALCELGFRVTFAHRVAPRELLTRLGADPLTFRRRDAAAAEVGGPGAYLDRAGFWHGAIGVASCWYGGAAGLAARLRASASRGKLDAHGMAHLGAVDSVLHAARCALRHAAGEIYSGALADTESAHARALQVRSIVESAARETLDRVGRALGPGPLAKDEEHAKRVADLTVYIRQSHAERDLAELGALRGTDDRGLL